MMTGSTSLYATRDPGGNLISLRQGAGSGSTNNYYTLDTLGSVLAATAPAGTSDLASYTYDPYGNTLTTGGSSPTTNPYRYTSGLYDSTNFTKLGDRYYNSGAERWTQRDAFAGSIEQPGTVDRYVYVSGNPVNATDPTGQFSLEDAFTGLSVFDTFAGFVGGVSAFVGAGAAWSLIGGGLLGAVAVGTLGVIGVGLFAAAAIEGYVAYSELSG